VKLVALPRHYVAVFESNALENYRKALMVSFYSGDQLQNIGYNSIIENELFIWS